jgi:hypothetical protein
MHALSFSSNPTQSSSYFIATATTTMNGIVHHENSSSSYGQQYKSSARILQDVDRGPSSSSSTSLPQQPTSKPATIIFIALCV